MSWRDHPLARPGALLPVLALLVAVHLPFLHLLLRGPAEVKAAVPFRDEYQRASLGESYWANGGDWRIVDGQIYSPGAGNNPLWLKARLPPDVRIEFDVRSEGADGDVKWEAFGDGRNHATGYVFIFGGWHNRESRIAKLDEHAATESELRASLASLAHPYPHRVPGLDAVWAAIRAPFEGWSARRALARLEEGAYYGPETPLVVKRTDLRVDRGRTYHMVVTRRGRVLRWEIDGRTALELDDPAPLSGSGHDRFGFSSWQNDTYFDNLKIEAL
ncbi:MAG TPA: hypothetical protein VIZ58_09095 [Thermoanaerobaculia bacterium]